ncbi:hypothetical protein HBI26_189400 [Parastagonospora nodorum]|nr:hypothetical protein HBI80_034270 [Parastagonospora nodorum]KAH4943687.1 hypothetical protein HBI79_021390 [Parastagonospora nodorum]KAH5561860.1 hypothetical protein HBI26_189400 [Parastagonospora nodorum]
MAQIEEYESDSEHGQPGGEERSLLPRHRQNARSWKLLPILAYWSIVITLLMTTTISLVMLARAQRQVVCEARAISVTGDRTYSPFVPDSVLEAPETLNYGYYIQEPLPSDTFHNVSILDQRLEELELLHMSTGVKVNGDYRSWIDENGMQRKLYPKITNTGEEVYLVASLHTMHCLAATIRNYGYLINGIKPTWSDAHVLHCFNKFYNTIACLSDSVVEGYQDYESSFDNSSGIIRRASEMASQPQCRNFGALRRWAAHPTRAIPFYYVSGHDEAREPLPEFCNVNRCRAGEGWL